MPTPTVWPMVLALGLSLVLAGMVTDGAISLLGLLLIVPAAIGWFRQVLPIEKQESIVPVVESASAQVERAFDASQPLGANRRKILPVETFRVTAGIKGGIAGGIAMALPAVLFSLIRFHSVWYAINLLAAGGFISWAESSDQFLSQFHLQGLLAAIAIHGITSLLVGLLYGAMLPMFPDKPILTAGFVAPLLWSGLVYSILGIVSPILNQRIDWLWFVISQLAFGLVAGFVINLDVRVRTPQFRDLPLAERAGLLQDSEKLSEKKDDRE
ncbi:MAG: hypothetical protein ABI824_17700 [Acidobacteriota bacterium]